MTAGGHVVLFDLDGTLIDSAPGIITGIAQAYEAVGLDVPDEALVRSWIGPPVRETLTRELGSRGDVVVQDAVAAFRAYFDTIGAHESVVFPGVHEALAQIADVGSVMVIVTHKPAPLAELALAQHGLDMHMRVRGIRRVVQALCDFWFVDGGPRRGELGWGSPNLDEVRAANATR